MPQTPRIRYELQDESRKAHDQVNQRNHSSTQLHQQPIKSHTLDESPATHSQNKLSPQKRDHSSIPYIPSYVPDCSALPDDDAQSKFSPADLEVIQANPELWRGIRGFTVERQIRAIAGWRQTNNAFGGASNQSETSHGMMAVVRESRGISGICVHSKTCKGELWGPHAIHFCDQKI